MSNRVRAVKKQRQFGRRRSPFLVALAVLGVGAIGVYLTTFSRAASTYTDSSYGAGGVAMYTASDRVSSEGMAYDATRDAVVVYGAVYVDANRKTEMKSTITRFDSNGKLDATFDSDGSKILGFDKYSTGTIRGLIVDSVGRYLVSSQYTTGKTCTSFVARILSDGKIDRTYGANGYASRLCATGDGLSMWGKLSIDKDGGVLVNSLSGVSRLTPDGKLDDSFSPFVVRNIPREKDIYSLASVATDAKNNVYIAAYGHNSDVNGAPKTTEAHIIKLTSAGDLDTSFGNGGIASYDYFPGEYKDPRSLHVDSQNRPVFSLTHRKMCSSGTTWCDYKTSIVRLTADGQRDVSWGANGVSDVKIGTVVALDSMNNVYNIGYTNCPTDSPRFASDRSSCAFYAEKLFAANGQHDTAFGDNGGKEVFIQDGYNYAIDNAVVDASNRLIIGGNVGNSVTKTAVIRFK